MKTACVREQDVLDMLAANRWPAGCEPHLEEHLQTCGICADLLAAAGALLEEHESAWNEARVPPSTLVWWRAQVRAREEAAREAARPIAFAQGIAASCAVWLAVSLLRSFPPPASDWRALMARAARHAPDVSAVAALIPGGLPLVIVIGASLLLTPIMVLLALRED
jgi:hypothetical protein